MFGAIEMTKQRDIDKYDYVGYRIGSDSKETFFVGTGVNVIIFRAVMSSSVHANYKIKNIVILGEGLIQGLEDTTLYDFILKL